MRRTYCPLIGGDYIMVPTIMGTAQRDPDGKIKTPDRYSSRDEHIILDEQPNIGILVEGIVFDDTD